jgi:hypothetical protein
MAEITVISKEAATALPKASSSNHTAWLEQLESAQWQQRLRYQPDSGQRQAGERATTEQHPAQLPARPGKTADFSQAEHARRQAGFPANAGGSDDRSAMRAAANAAPSAEAPPAFGAGQSGVQERPVGIAARGGQAWLPVRRMPTVNWQAQYAHVMAGNEGLRMWLRDARYEKSEGYRLLLELRARFAGLGFRLAEFTLNGERIVSSVQSGQSGQSD